MFFEPARAYSFIHFLQPAQMRGIVLKR